MRGVQRATADERLPAVGPFWVKRYMHTMALDLAAHGQFHNATFRYQGGVYNTTYRVFGDLYHSIHTPLVVVHGGPGLSHDYLLPLADLSHYHIPVIFYDQLGNGRSTRVHDKPDTFWQIDLFLDEFENLLNHLGIPNRFDVYGHSWGGMLGQELVIRRKPHGLRRLVLADTIANYTTWNDSVGQRISTLPEKDQEAIGAGRDGDNYDAWRAGMNALYAQYGCRVQPLPPPMAYSLGLNLDKDADLTVDNAMEGPGGALTNWSTEAELHRIHVPTLVIHGKYDLAQDFVVAPLVERIPGAKSVKLENSSHSPQWEQRHKLVSVVHDFLQH